MPRPALTPSEIEKFRKRAVRAATRLFAKSGYEAVTMRAIAKELGGSAMATYRYFDNKAELFALVRAHALRTFADSQKSAFEAARDPLDRMVRMRAAYAESALKHPDEYRVGFEVVNEVEAAHPELAAEERRLFAIHQEAARQAIAFGVFEGEPTVVALQLWASMHGLVSLHLAGKLPDGCSFDELLVAPLLKAGPRLR